MKRAGAVIVAGGSGSRMGRPKQFLELAGKPVVLWTLEAFRAAASVGEIVVVLNEDDFAERAKALEGPKTRFAKAGATRMGSVRSGLAALSTDLPLVAIHDGARPLIEPGVIEACLDAAGEHGASVPAVPVKDTLKEVESGTREVASTPERARYWAAQTPQCYRRDVLDAALEKFADDQDATDESQLVDRLGRKVHVVESSYENFKVTTPEDLTLAEAILRARTAPSRGDGAIRAPVARVGMGYDIHKLVAGRPLMLGGIEIPHDKGLLGHSDGDAVLHAVCDALLGAAGLGEIGIAFPPDDPKFKGIDSKEILAHTLAKLDARGMQALNVDVTLVAQEPKIKPHYAAIRSSLAKRLGLPEDRVNFKAKSHEELGPIGQGLAIACYAVATVV